MPRYRTRSAVRRRSSASRTRRSYSARTPRRASRARGTTSRVVVQVVAAQPQTPAPYVVPAAPPRTRRF